MHTALQPREKRNYPGSMFHSQITSARAKYESKCFLVHWILSCSWGCHFMLLCESFGLSLLFCLGCHEKVLVASLDFTFCFVQMCCIHHLCCWGCFPFELSKCVMSFVFVAGVVFHCVIEVGFHLLVRVACGCGGLPVCLSKVAVW